MLFDLDGTLIDSAQDIVASIQHALGCVDAREPPGWDEVVCLVGRPLDLILRDLGYPADAGSTGRFTTTYRDYYARHFCDHTRPFPGVVDVLAALRQAGVRLAIITTKHQTQAELVVAGCGLKEFFNVVRGHLDGRQQKPHPEPVIAVLKELGVSGADAIVVGDTELDVAAGRSAGTATCAVAYGYRPAELLRTARPDFLLGDIRDLVPIVTARN